MSRQADHHDNELRDEAVEFAPEEPDLIYQLGEKIRLQARRLTTLEQYKMLCEKRILELNPSHPLPVRQDHLGRESTDLKQLHQAQVKIARLEQQLTQGGSAQGTITTEGLQSLLMEKATLEDTLRAEILHSEEQRALIEALKQALEERSQSTINLEIAANFEKLQAEYSACKGENQRLYSALQDRASDIDTLTAALKHREEDLGGVTDRLSEETGRCEEYAKNCDQLRAELAAQETLVKRLEDQRGEAYDTIANLEDTIARQKDAIRELESDLQTIRDEHSGLKRKHEDTHSALSDRESHSRALARERDDLEEARKLLIAELTKTKGELEEIRGLAQESEKRVEELTSDNEAMRERLGELDKSVEDHTVNTRTMQLAIDQLTSELASAQAQKTYFQTALNNAKQETGEKEAAEFKAKGELNQLQRALQRAMDEMAEGDRRTQLREQDSLRKIAALEREKAEAEAKWNKEKEAHSRYVAETSEEIKRLESESQRRLQQLEAQSSEALKRTESDSQSRIQQLEGQLRVLSMDSSEQVKALQREVEKLTATLETVTAESNDHALNRERTHSELRNTSTLLEAIIKERDALMADLDTTKGEVRATRAEVQRLQEHNESLEDQLRQTAEELQEVKKAMQELDTEHEAALHSNEQLQEAVETLQASEERLLQDLAEARKAGKEEKSRAERLESAVAGALQAVRGLVEKLASVIEVREVESMSTLQESITALAALISTAESRLSASSRNIQSLRSQLDKSSKDLSSLESLLQSRSAHESEIFMEIQTLREQLTAERLTHTQQIDDANGEYDSLEQQYQRSLLELKDHRDQLREFAIENNDLQRDAAEMSSEIARLEVKLSGAMAEKRRSEMLLGRFLKVGQLDSDFRRVMTEMVETSNELNTVERLREVVRARIEGLEAEDNSEDVQRALQTERSSLLRSDTEAAKLQQRLQALDQDLEELSRPRSAIPQLSFPSARFDLRTSPYLSTTSRPADLKERLMRTSPIMVRSPPEASR